MRALALVVAALALGGCSEGCGRMKAVDYDYRQKNITLHRVGGICVVVGIFNDGDSAAMAAAPCPPEAP